MGSTAELQFVVDSLNQPPFEKELTLVTFDEQTPQELLQILNDVFCEISTDHNVDLRDEAVEDTVQRMSDFLWILKYKSNVADPFIFRTGLINGDKNIVYPILYWTLQRIPELRKRAYLAKYLMSIEVPLEMQTDDVFLQYKDKQEEFKTAHKEVDRIRTSGFEPSALKRDIQALEEEKVQLLGRLTKSKKKVQDMPNLDKYLEAIGGLRKEMEEKEKLASKLEEQKNVLAQSRQRSAKVAESFKETKSLASSGGTEAYIQRLSEDTKTNKFMATERLPLDIEEKREWLEQLKRVMNEPVLTDQGRQTLVMDITNLRKDIKTLVDKRDSVINPTDDKLNLFRQQAVFVEKKKDEKEARFKDISEELSELEREVKEKSAKYENEGAKILRGEELDNYVANLRKKTQTFRKYKAELADLKTEYGILSRTQEILQSRDSNLKEFLDDMATKKGVRGYDTTMEKIENVSVQKSEADEDKAKTLEEISKIVTEISNNIKDRRTKLAPMVKELRVVRQEYQELEVVYNEKKSIYDNTKLALESERAKLEQETQLFEEDAVREESKFHFMNCMADILDVQIIKAQEKGELTHKDGKNFKDIYNKKIAEQENMSKSLRERQKEIKENHEPSLRQREMFMDVHKILRKKMELYNSQSSRSNGGERENRKAIEM